MITPKVTGAIITALIIILGVALLFPALKIDTKFGSNTDTLTHSVLLTFNIINSSNMPSWCYDLSSFLKNNNIHSTVFMTGIIADAYPDCVSRFSTDTDIGSMSYSQNSITSIPTYPAQLSTIKDGKRSVDLHGELNSTLFRAPFGQVDENIYSLLTRSHILADFSYIDHYNVYTDGLSGKTFYRFPLALLDKFSASKSSVADPKIPMMITFDNHDSLIEVKKFINASSDFSHNFVSASELTNMDLTIR